MDELVDDLKDVELDTHLPEHEPPVRVLYADCKDPRDGKPGYSVLPEELVTVAFPKAQIPNIGDALARLTELLERRGLVWDQEVFWTVRHWIFRCQMKRS